MRREIRRSSGFTLIEILVVVVIIGIMASAVIINLKDKPYQAKLARAQADISIIETSMEMYATEHPDYPDDLQELEPKYLKRLRNDPWGNAYQLRNPGTHGEVDIFSLGRDGSPGGDGKDADIGNWDLR